MTSTGFGIYIHWPFCRSKCPYCDFNSHAARQIDQTRWRAALLRELDHFAERHPRSVVTSIFFGGGTPSLMDPATCAALIERVGQVWPMADQVEITLEANPSTAEMGRFADFRAAGVNRLSLGVQSLNDECLRFLGRGHDAAQALAAIDLASRLFPRFSFDLIYARPEQSLRQWQEELARALTLTADHLSLYQLTIEDGTAFAPRYERGEFHLPDDELAADFYRLTQEMTEAAGLPAYEVSNHARPGAESRHNLVYWLGGDYAGIGPGAHGRLCLHAYRQHANPQIWLDSVESLGHGTEECEILTPNLRGQEALMMGLRLVHGIKAETFLNNTGIDVWSVADRQQAEILQQEGLLRLSNRDVKATKSGMLVLNAVLQQVLK